MSEKRSTPSQEDPDKIVINDAGVFAPNIPGYQRWLFVGTKCWSWEGARLASVTQLSSSGGVEVVREDMFCSNMNFHHNAGFPFLLCADTQRQEVHRYSINLRTPDSIRAQ